MKNSLEYWPVVQGAWLIEGNIPILRLKQGNQIQQFEDLTYWFFSSFRSPNFCNLCVRKFDRLNLHTMKFDDFIQCCVMLKSLTDAFRKHDHQQTGTVTISYEQVTRERDLFAIIPKLFKYWIILLWFHVLHHTVGYFKPNEMMEIDVFCLFWNILWFLVPYLLFSTQSQLDKNSYSFYDSSNINFVVLSHPNTTFKLNHVAWSL